jgi:hypothetical protein
MPKVALKPKAPAAPKPALPTRPGGMIRPLYGVFIRDQVADLRTQIQGTLGKVEKEILKGKPNAKEVSGDGKLQGTELAKAKKAAADLKKAIAALKPVLGDVPSIGRPTPVVIGDGRFRPLYGVVMRDDLSNFRTSIGENVRTINAAINNGELKGAAKTEGQKAVKALQAALKDLGAVTW